MKWHVWSTTVKIISMSMQHIIGEINSNEAHGIFMVCLCVKECIS